MFVGSEGGGDLPLLSTLFTLYKWTQENSGFFSCSLIKLTFPYHILWYIDGLFHLIEKKKLSTIHLCVYVSQILYFILTVSAPKKEYTWNQIKKIDTTKKKNIKHCFYQYIPVHEDINSNLQCRNSSQRAGTYTVWHQMQWASALSSSACIYLMGIGKMASCTLIPF